MRLIDEEYTRHPFYGSRKMRAYLHRLSHPVTRKRVQRLMRKLGLASIDPKPNTSRQAPEHQVYPYLLRDVAINRANRVWCSDLTYIRLYIYRRVPRGAIPILRFSAPIRARSIPARPSPGCSRTMLSTSAWMARDGPWTTSWSSACGAR